MADGLVVYNGPSLLDPTKNIIAVLTNVRRKSKNPKTGPMAQLWMLVRDTAPTRAEVNGDDAAVCGNCPLRTILLTRQRKTRRGWVEQVVKIRKCYVTMFQAVTSIWKTFHRGGYRNADVRDPDVTKRNVRLGAFGEPTAIPLELVATISQMTGTTGYTHQWRTQPGYRSLVMASVESPDEAAAAKAAGWRTFRTIGSLSEPLFHDEILCPATDEGGSRTTCDRCLLCNGNRPYLRNGTVRLDHRKNIVVLAHGQQKGRF